MFKNYIKTAWRNLLRSKTYSAINIGGLAIALTAFWLIALYVVDELSYDRYHENAGRIVRVVQHTRWNGNDIHEAPTSAPFAPALQAAFPEIEEAVRIDMEGGAIITWQDKKIKQEDLINADKSLLKIFSYHFIYGDPHSALDRPQSIVITESLANKIFGSPAQAINQTLTLNNNTPNKVTGVIRDIPANSHLRFSGVRSFDDGFTEGWQNFHLYTYLLLKKGTDYRDLEKKLPQFAAGTIQKIMRVNDYKMELQPITSIHLHSNLSYELSANGSISRVYMFIAIAALILLIAMINYMNLSTARAASRVKEIGVRKVIGSGRKHIAWQFITEALLITLLSAMIAMFLVTVFLPWFNSITGKELTVWHFGTFTTLFILAIFSLITGLFSGLYPALFLSGFKTIPALKGQLGNLLASVRFRKSLVAFQFVITAVMISCSLVIYEQLRYALRTDLGFNKEQVLTFHIDSRKVREQIPAIKTQLLQNPLVQGVSAAGNPIGNNDLGGLGYRFETPEGNFSTSTIPAQELMVDADFLPTMEIKLLAGRSFSTEVQTDKYGAALINETMLKKLGWKDAIGKRMQFAIDDAGTTAERTVIGVIKDFHTYSLQHKIEPLVMVMPPVTSMEDNLYVKLARGKTKEGLAFLDQVYKRFDASNMTEYHFLDQNFARQYEAEEKQGKIASIFTLLAVLIACLGLFGLATFTAAQRTKEIGIRKVLGAGMLNIIQVFSQDFMVLLGIAALIAVPLAWMIMYRWLQEFAYRISIQWWVFAVSGVLIALIAMITVGYHAIRIARRNPVNSLRNE